jgi:hypothetical protein
VNIARQMYDRLNQVASTRDEAIAEIARGAFRAFLDDQEDLIASRKHFTKSFQRRLDHTDWQLSVQLQMLSHLTALFMTMINKERIGPEDVLHIILEMAQEDDWQNILHNARETRKGAAIEKTNRQLR